MAKKNDDKITKAGAVELEEGELDNVTGGTSFLKLGDIEGESAIGVNKSGSFLKIDTVSVKDPVAKKPGGLTDIKFV